MKKLTRSVALITLSVSMILLLGQCQSEQQSPSGVEDTDEGTVAQDVIDLNSEAETEERPGEKGGKKDKKKAPAGKEAKEWAPLTITVTNLKSATAPIIFSVYENQATYLKPKVQLKTYRYVPDGNTAELTITDLEFGTYAIAFYQDMNDSGDLDKNGMGIPKEPYAFSNNIRPKLKAPTFEDCKFDYSKDDNSITVKMGK